MAIPSANANPYFETDASNWTGVGGTAVRSTAQAHEGVASLLLTPGGVATTARVESEQVSGADAGEVWLAEAWVRCAVSRNVSIGINWFTAASAYLTTSSSGGTYAVTANTWTKVSVKGTGPATAAKASITIDMSSTPPNTHLLYVDEAVIRPGASITVTPDPNNVPPRMIIEIEYVDQVSATVVRNDPDGTTNSVRLGDPTSLDGSGQAVLFDYESWFGSTTTYEVTTAGGTVSSVDVLLDVPDIWLRHPGIPSLSQKIDFQGEGEPVRPVMQAVFEPLGRTTPIVVSDGQRKSKRGEITIRTSSDTEHEDLLGLLDDVSAVLLDIPPSKGFGSDLAHQYLSIGDLTMRRRIEGYYPDPHRIWSAPYIVVGRPAGGIASQRTYADLVDDFLSYQAVRNRYTTYTNVLTGA